MLGEHHAPTPAPAGENGERRAQRPAQHHAIPRLLALAPNGVWSWDITKLPRVRRGIYLSLYVVLDLFSRFVVAWELLLYKCHWSALQSCTTNPSRNQRGQPPHLDREQGQDIG